MSYNLFLDDERSPEWITWVEYPQDVKTQPWVIVRNFNEFKETILTKGIPEFISFDNDLADEHYKGFFKCVETRNPNFDYGMMKEKTGYDCAKWLVGYAMENGYPSLPHFIIHSKNFFVAADINKLFNDYWRGFDHLLGEEVLDNYVNLDDTVFMSDSQVPEYAVQDNERISGFFGDYRFLSNFWTSPVKMWGLTFPSVECAYQAAKSIDPTHREKFANVNAGQAKKLGRAIILRPDWEQVKEGIMFYLVFQKFDKHPELLKQLLATGQRKLEETNNWKDSYWGVDVNKGGLNRLGEILMQVRKALSNG